MQSISLAAPQPRRTLLHFIIDHNPCYLLSGALMLFGCWLLNSALYTKAGDIGRLLLLLLIINLYEGLLIALGLTLIRRIAFRNDGRILLGLQALFLVDVAFITGIIATIDLRWGVLINLVVFGLSALKVWIILRGLCLTGAGRMCAFIGAQIFLLLMVPVLFKWVAVQRNGHVPPLAVYGAWWMAGLVPVLGLALHRLPPSRRLLDPPGRERAMGVLFLILPFASLLVHLYSAGWVYSSDFSPAFAAPVVLGLALGANLLEGPRLQRYLIARVQLVLVAAAVSLSVASPQGLLFSLGREEALAISPLRLVLLASSLLLVYFVWRHHSLKFLALAAACLAAASLGHSLPVIGHNLVMLIISTRRITTLQLGVLSVAGAFAMLGVGALLSLKKHADLHRPAVLVPEAPPA